MALKIILFASFAVTGSLFYLSKSAPAAKPVQLEALPRPTSLPMSPTVAAKKKTVKVADSTPVESYDSLLPRGSVESVTPRPARKVTFSDTVKISIKSCYDYLVARRTEIWKARDGDADLSFHGEIKLTATFENGRVTSLRSRSSEVRDEKFHNCIETEMHSWQFPADIASRPDWSYAQIISYDVNYKFTCKDGSIVLPGAAIGAKKCL